MNPGPAPKDPSQRRRRNVPSAGEWTDLMPLDKPVLPPLPKRPRGRGQWSAETREMWAAWREDPATGQYTSADIGYAVDTAYLLEECIRSSRVTWATEVRRRMDGLGLTPKGKRYLRWRIAEPAEVVQLPARISKRTQARMRRITAVDPEAS